MNSPSEYKKLWLGLIGQPSDYAFEPSFKLAKRYETPEFDAEMYLQANEKGTFQRVLMMFPKNITEPCPAVAVPFYFPEAMLGYDIETGEILDKYRGIEMMLHLTKRGYVTASADSYHLSYIESERSRDDFRRWHDAAKQLNADCPNRTGIGKLIHDTKLLLDALEGDSRVDSSRIGIAGHSLGGKMAFYTGCLDDRVKAILASDFGIGWDQTNWSDIWYWGDKVTELKSRGIDHSSLLRAADGKPFYLIAGHYDNDESLEIMRRSGMYEEGDRRLGFENHATGHRPPWDALLRGYEFLDAFLMA